jgi:hypothetical protein
MHPNIILPLLCLGGEGGERRPTTSSAKRRAICVPHVYMWTHTKGPAFPKTQSRRNPPCVPALPFVAFVNLISLADLKATKGASGRNKDLADLDDLPLLCPWTLIEGGLRHGGWGASELAILVIFPSVGLQFPGQRTS